MVCFDAATCQRSHHNRALVDLVIVSNNQGGHIKNVACRHGPANMWCALEHVLSVFCQRLKNRQKVLIWKIIKFWMIYCSYQIYRNEWIDKYIPVWFTCLPSWLLRSWKNKIWLKSSWLKVCRFSYKQKADIPRC